MSRILADLSAGLHSPRNFPNGVLDPATVHRGAPNVGQTPTVAIVGAGIAGLRCADMLLKAGISVAMYEARDRIGGRVHQIQSAGRLIDLGANWIHGSDGNPIERIAQRTKTTLYSPEEDYAIFDSSGARKSNEETKCLSETVWAIIAEAFKYSDDYCTSIDPSKSLMDYFREETPKRESDPAKVSEILKLAQMWGPYIGDPIEKQSLKFFFLEECIDGANPFVASTYRDILAEIGENALENAEIHFNQPISRFEVESSSQVTVVTEAGFRHSFDEVVVTCPLGWLQRNLAAFHPALPVPLTKAIQNANYGRLEKIYVTFPSAFWYRADPQAPENLVPRFTEFLSPDYAPHPPDEAWNQGTMSLAHLPGSTAHPTLLYYIYGPCATEVVRSITGVVPQSPEYDEILDSFAKPFYSLLPFYDAENPDCHPVAFLATQWQNDPYAGNGSYANYQVGHEVADQDIECMRKAMGADQGIWLAGEHTAPFIALGTTTGAYWAGEGVARRICAKYEIKVVEDDDSKRAKVGE